MNKQDMQDIQNKQNIQDEAFSYISKNDTDDKNSANITSVLHLEDVVKSFGIGKQKLNILKGITLSIKAGESVALLGQSGSGKTTLLNIAGLLDNPCSGKVIINGLDVSCKKDRTRTNLRRDYLGFVYQNHNLLPEFTALENVLLPLMIAGRPKKWVKERALSLLDMLGLSDRIKHLPSELSGGEQQRVAIARALANEPLLLLADEPTGNLDDETSQTVFELLLKTIKYTGLATIVATHNPDLASKLDKQVYLKNGLLVV